MKNLLFQKVKCKSYLRKIYDGRFIQTYKNDDNLLDCEYVDTNNPNLDIECECDGTLEFLKTYYERKEKEFYGMLVGFKDIVATGYLIAETDGYGTIIRKQAKDIVRCAIVYYANNKKRYVPIDEVEEFKK